MDNNISMTCDVCGKTEKATHGHPHPQNFAFRRIKGEVRTLCGMCGGRVRVKEPLSELPLRTLEKFGYKHFDDVAGKFKT